MKSIIKTPELTLETLSRKITCATKVEARGGRVCRNISAALL